MTDTKKGKKAEKKSEKKQAKQAKKQEKRAQKEARALAPKAIKTGKGAAAAEVAEAVAALLRDGKAHEVESEWMAPGVESVEGVGVALAWSGRKAVLAKYRAWEADHEIHSMQIEGPWVGATGFALRYAIDVTQKSTGQRSQMEEIAVYTVKNGKIAREEFHFRLPG